LAGVPAPTSGCATRDALETEVIQLQIVVEAAQKQIETNHAHKILMEAENRRLQAKLFKREMKHLRKEVTGC
jgi:hypothetical protein